MNWYKMLSPAFGALRAVPFERSSHGLLGGVCAAISEKTGLSVWIIRGVFLLSGFLPIVSLPLYAALWALVPDGLGTIHAEEWLKEISSK